MCNGVNEWNVLISIIIPVYKVERYIERCILSVIQQDFGDSEVECILVDDCSPDQSISYAKKIIEKYGGNISFHIISCEHNGGLSVARNIGMKQSIGKYVFFLDSDDYLTENSMSIFLNKLQEFPNVEMLMGNHIYTKTGKSYINSRRIPQGVIDNNKLMELYYQQYIPVMAWNSLILKNLLLENQLQFKQGIVEEDMVWAAQLYPCVNRFVFIPDNTLVYEYNPSSIMNTKESNLKRYLTSHAIISRTFISMPTCGHEVSSTVYITSYLLEILDVIRKHCDSKSTLPTGIYDVRRQLVKRTLLHGRIILLVFELVLFEPFIYLTELRMFRKNFRKLQYVVRYFALCFDFLHIKK